MLISREEAARTLWLSRATRGNSCSPTRTCIPLRSLMPPGAASRKASSRTSARSWGVRRQLLSVQGNASRLPSPTGQAAQAHGFSRTGTGDPCPWPSQPPDPAPPSVRTLSSGNLVRCPVCQEVPLTGRQTVCSARCRIARSRQRRQAQHRERDAHVRRLLKEALDLLTKEES